MPTVNSSALGPFFAGIGTLMCGMGADGGGVPESLWQPLTAAKTQRTNVLFHE